MRILGFSKKWDKLKNDTFTTFRFERRDADWEVGEVVQIVYKPRSRVREVLGMAEIINKEARDMSWVVKIERGVPKVTNEEAIADGFQNGKTKDLRHKKAYYFMWEFLWACYGSGQLLNEPMNKLTLRNQGK